MAQIWRLFLRRIQGKAVNIALLKHFCAQQQFPGLRSFGTKGLKCSPYRTFRDFRNESHIQPDPAHTSVWPVLLIATSSGYEGTQATSHIGVIAHLTNPSISFHGPLRNLLSQAAFGALHLKHWQVLSTVAAWPLPYSSSVSAPTPPRGDNQLHNITRYCMKMSFSSLHVYSTALYWVLFLDIPASLHFSLLLTHPRIQPTTQRKMETISQKLSLKPPSGFQVEPPAGFLHLAACKMKKMSLPSHTTS